MDFKVYPTKFEIYEEATKEVVAIVEAQDEVCFSVEIKGSVTKHEWKDISDAIYKCLITDEGL